jgi:DNA-binding response OmpR family regulator
VGDSVDILIIDDNEMLLEYITDLLTSHGFTIHTTKNSFDAVKTMQNVKPRLVILDVMMPELDGYTVLKKMREDKDLSSVPVIIYTGKSYPTDEKKARSLGANSYIVKPVKGSVIIEEVKKYI